MKLRSVVLLLFLTACSLSTVRIDAGLPVVYTVGIADAPEERSKGLMYTLPLGTGKGMLFVFEEQRTLSFWMKNVDYPLDILFINENFTIVDAQSMQPCTAECEMHESAQPAMYAVEIPGGDIERYDLRPGQPVDMQLR